MVYYFINKKSPLKCEKINFVHKYVCLVRNVCTNNAKVDINSKHFV